MMKSIFLFLILASNVSFLMAQTVLLNENFTNGIPSAWAVFDEDQLSPDSSVLFVNEAWVGLSTATDTCAVSTSYYTVTGSDISQASDYLITPKVDLLAFGHLLSWDSKSFDGNYPESYYVLLSTTDSMPSSFTDTIKFVDNDSPNWKTFTSNLFLNGFANQSVFIAFKNASTNQYLLGIDNVKLTTNDVASNSKQEVDLVNIYPNPTNGRVQLNLPNGTAYEIIDISGKTIATGQVLDGNIDLARLQNGIYFIKVKIGNKSFSKKIVKA